MILLALVASNIELSPKLVDMPNSLSLTDRVEFFAEDLRLTSTTDTDMSFNINYSIYLINIIFHDCDIGSVIQVFSLDIFY